MRQATIQFQCTVCKKPIYRLGSSVDPGRKLCGKHAKFAAPLAPINTDFAEVEKHVVALTGVVSEIQARNKQRLEYYQQKLNMVADLIVTLPDTPFDELWSMASRKQDG